MTYETADQWLDYIELDWIEDEDCADELLRVLTLEDEASDGSAALKD
jgi:hypothetical protein